MHCHSHPESACLQVRRLHETFHEPFRKAMRQGPLSFSPTLAMARQGSQIADQAAPAATQEAQAASAGAMPMEPVMEDLEDQFDPDL